VVEIEISDLDLRYSQLRIRNRKREGRLLSSIAERGVVEPLEGVDADGLHLLLNGFKRYRCACRLNLKTVPYTCLGPDAVTGIAALLTNAQTRHLTILEQAAFVDQLRKLERLSIAEIAELLGRSKAWVSVRAGLIGDMTELIRQKLFGGVFPVYSYMYTLRQFMRINSANIRQIEQFVVALSGKGLSIRQIEQLAYGYFRGCKSFRRQIRSGNIGLVLHEATSDEPVGCNRYERAALKDLAFISKAMRRVMDIGHYRRLQTPAFCAQADLLTGRILNQWGRFIRTMRQLHDRSGYA